MLGPVSESVFMFVLLIVYVDKLRPTESVAPVGGCWSARVHAIYVIIFVSFVFPLVSVTLSFALFFNL